ncbi:GH92 family glycosyl hydrolase [Psychromonas ossibalaenae]|uniref:GH92 family glycosyl hydrolase n=1 Tax=Psychromonas ossibalaenae TaxID=444922 RepID=UPI000369F05C|nr:GH92 family glycosyl hydrolase [Psychromonas ossibalaenae]
MFFKRSLTAAAVAVALSFALAGCNDDSTNIVEPEPSLDLVQYVDPLIGTGGLANTYPGATVPHGMVQLSPNNGTGGWDYISGYSYHDDRLVGFSHTQLSGTGAGDLNDILIMPFNSRSDQKRGEQEASYYSHDKEQAEAGFYSVVLDDYGIEAELTTTNRVGFHRYSFPQDGDSKVVLNLGYSQNWDSPTDTVIRVVDETTLEGYRYSTGWAADQREHFVIKFSKPMTGFELRDDLNNQIEGGSEVQSSHTRGYFSFDTSEQETEVLVKVALSSADIEGAYKNLEHELPGWDFDQTRTAASQAWQDELQKVRVTSDDEAKKRIFYTAIYHSYLGPTLHSDVDGRYKGADHQIQQAQGFDRYDTFSLWDTYRAVHPFQTLVEPERVNDMVNSMLAHYQETGLLPVWSMKGNETNMMLGYHSVPVITDAWLKGIDGFDPQLALQAMKDSADSPREEIVLYREKGYVPYSEEEGGDSWAASRAMEYSYDDWGIAQMAKSLGDQAGYEHFIKQAKNWENQYDASRAWFVPRLENGEFIADFDPERYEAGFAESNGWQYFWHVQHDTAGVIDKLGQEAYIQRLDDLFETTPDPAQELPIFSTGMVGQYVQGNEPDHHAPYLYNYVGQPWKTQKWLKEIVDVCYTDQPEGICGNDDYGQMSSWYVFTAMGFYPVNPADQRYIIGSPIFPKVELNQPNGNTFTITAENVSEQNIYIQSVSLNDISLDRSWISHDEITQGGTLSFVMGDTPNQSWASTPENFPPSWTAEGLVK